MSHLRERRLHAHKAAKDAHKQQKADYERGKPSYAELFALLEEWRARVTITPEEAAEVDTLIDEVKKPK